VSGEQLLVPTELDDKGDQHGNVRDLRLTDFIRDDLSDFGASIRKAVTSSQSSAITTSGTPTS
jgi:hypothetical protein